MISSSYNIEKYLGSEWSKSLFLETVFSNLSHRQNFAVWKRISPQVKDLPPIQFDETVRNVMKFRPVAKGGIGSSVPLSKKVQKIRNFNYHDSWQKVQNFGPLQGKTFYQLQSQQKLATALKVVSIWPNTMKTIPWHSFARHSAETKGNNNKCQSWLCLSKTSKEYVGHVSERKILSQLIAIKGRFTVYWKSLHLCRHKGSLTSQCKVCFMQKQNRVCKWNVDITSFIQISCIQ